jgi:hypothetical protein
LSDSEEDEVATLSPLQAVEFFHLALLDLLGRKIPKDSYAVKGGCNLRFFLGSPRYSEDMDLDVDGISLERLDDAVRAITLGKTFADVLAVRGISVARCSSPKQTETTQRWKFGLSLPGSDVQTPTKLEASRRGMRAGVDYGPLHPSAISRYSLTPFMVSHYAPEAAYLQKVEALATRRATQARDVFDLHLLVLSGRVRVRPEDQTLPFAARAAQNAMSVTFGVFRSQVLSYLDPDRQGQYDSRDVWDTMVLAVARALEGDEL